MKRLILDAAATNRWIDPANGYLHVNACKLTKAAVDAYYGREIAGHEALGLDADAKYLLYRPADELRKALATLNGVPLLNKHDDHFDAANYDAQNIIGAIGTDARFEDPYVVAQLIVYDRDAIDDVESGVRAALSCGYAYRPVLESGTFQGVCYDLKMTEIRFNHVALVKEGRVGPEVRVADSGERMSERECMNEEEKIDCPPRLPDEPVPEPGADEPAPDEEIELEIARLEKRLAELKAMLDGRIVHDNADPAGEKVSAAMDAAATAAAVEAALRRRYFARDEALDKVRPFVGELRASALDSAEAVYRYALVSRNVVPPDGVNLAGLQGMVDVLTAVGNPAAAFSGAADAAESKGDSPFAGSRVRVLGFE